MKDLKLELYIINQKLDSDRLPPVDRRRLLRQRAVIKKRLTGRDPLYFVDVKTGRVDGGLNELYQTKKCVIKILEILEKEISNGRFMQE